LLRHRRSQERTKRAQDRIADAITRFAGSMTFVYVHVIVFGLWIVVNLGWLPGVPRFDETFVVLAMIASKDRYYVGPSQVGPLELKREFDPLV
jgi:uncharacterized membrane protein